MINTKNLLIAEDDPVLREVYVKKFTIAGYTIRVSSNGEEAEKAIAEQAPDALVLDINMPVKDGFTVLQDYPKDKRGFPIVILTNFGDERSKQRGLELGADDYYVKSDMTIKTLIEMVNKLLGVS